MTFRLELRDKNNALVGPSDMRVTAEGTPNKGEYLQVDGLASVGGKQSLFFVVERRFWMVGDGTAYPLLRCREVDEGVAVG